jgi:hypothetical protein
LILLDGGQNPSEAPIVLAELHKDVVLKALVDELERNRTELKLSDSPPLYFLEYQLVDAIGLSVAAELGAITAKALSRGRRLRTDVRVGSYELDNTNFRGSGGPGGFGGVLVPIEDDYLAVRQAIWWQTDRRYKEAVEQLAEKKAFMAGRMIEDKPNDFSREEPALHFDERLEMKMDEVPLAELVRAASDVFRGFPYVKESAVSLQSAAGSKYLVNSEGTRLRTSSSRYSISVFASTQADDGMELSISAQFDSRTPATLPSVADLRSHCEELARRLEAVRSAPILPAYSGPVLFEAQPMSVLFLRLMSGRFAGGQRPLGTRASPDDFANKLNRRVLPRFMDVVDDPTQDSILGIPVMSHYRFDDQGVRARPVSLVDDGKLLSLVHSRNPSKEFSNSTGHGRGSFGPRPATACLVISGNQTLDHQELRSELLDTAQDEGLPFAIRVESLGSDRGGSGGRDGTPGLTPLEVYKVYPDGREELVRGIELGRIDLKGFKRILAIGNSPHVLNTSGAIPQTVVCPATLFEELDLAKVDRDFDRPPVIPSPVARAYSQSADPSEP